MMFRYGRITCWTCERVLHEGWPRWWHALTRFHRATIGPRYKVVHDKFGDWIREQHFVGVDIPLSPAAITFQDLANLTAQLEEALGLLVSGDDEDCSVCGGTEDGCLPDCASGPARAALRLEKLVMGEK